MDRVHIFNGNSMKPRKYASTPKRDSGCYKALTFISFLTFMRENVPN
jgi:hypothetical protein